MKKKSPANDQSTRMEKHKIVTNMRVQHTILAEVKFTIDYIAGKRR
jgi:hypothetical protein